MSNSFQSISKSVAKKQCCLPVLHIHVSLLFVRGSMSILHWNPWLDFYMSSGLNTSGLARGAWLMLMLILLRLRSSCSNLSRSSSSAFLLSASARSSGVRILAGSRPSSIMRCMSASAPCWIMPWLGQGSNGRLLKDSSQSCDCWGIASRPTISDRAYGVFSLSCAPGGGVAIPLVIWACACSSDVRGSLTSGIGLRKVGGTVVLDMNLAYRSSSSTSTSRREFWALSSGGIAITSLRASARSLTVSLMF